MKRIGLYYVATGLAGEHEDWWTLVQHDDGSHQVEHDWERKDARCDDRAMGPDKLSVEEALNTAPSEVAVRLKSILDQ